MARSRPKLSQSPWSGLDAVRKIMDRFGEFGESLNRMAGALHGLEDSMKHLLGVTSRVTAAMLMLHGSLAYTGKPKGNGGSSDDQEVWDKRKADNLAEKADNKKISEAENSERKKKIRQEKDQNAKIDRLYKERLRLENLSKFGKSRKETDLETFQKDSRREFNIKRSQATTFFENQKLSPKLLADPKLTKEQTDLIKLQKDSFTEASTPDPTTKIAPGPTDKDIARWVLDTEYSYASKQKTPEAANADLNTFSKQEQDTRQQVTQLSLIGVNKLGQILESLSLEIEPVLKSKETLFNAGNSTQAEHDTWKANEAKKTNRVSMADAEAQLKAFAASKGVTQALINNDVNAPKLNAKNFVGAEGQVLGQNNPFNKGLGNALGLPQMTDENKRKEMVDPLLVAMNSILNKIRTLKFDDLPAVAKGFDLDLPSLEQAHKKTSGGASQPEIAKLFNMNFGGKGAHDADSDTEMYAKLMPLVSSMSRIVMKSIDTRDLKAYLEDIGFGESEEANLEKIKQNEYENLPHVKAKDKTIADIDTEASRLATEEAEARVIAIALEGSPVPVPVPVPPAPVPVPVPPTPVLPTPVPPAPVPPTPVPVPPAPTTSLPKSLKDLGLQLQNLFKRATSTIASSITSKLNGIDFSKVMGGGMENAKEAFSALTKGLLITATAASGAVVGLSQLASADVFATFQNSVILLGMTVGSAFKEPMLKLAWYIQQLAGQFENMSPAVRENLTSLAQLSIYIVGASLALKALSIIISPIAMVAKGLWSLVVALGAAVAAIAKQGLGTAIGNGIAGLMGGSPKDAMGLGGSWMGAAGNSTLKFAGVVARTTLVVAGVTEAFLGLIDILFQTKYSMTSRLASGMVDSAEAKTERAINGSDKRPETEEDKARILKNFDQNKEYAKKQIDSTPELANLFNEKVKNGYAKASAWDKDLNKTDHPLHAMLNHPALSNVSNDEKETFAKRYNQADQQYHKAKIEGNEKGMDLNRTEIASILGETWKAGQVSRGTPNKPDEHIDKLKDYAAGQHMQPGFGNEAKTTKDRKSEKEKENAKKDFESGGGMKGLLMSLQSFRSQPSYMGVEEAHRRIQVEALKSDPLEQKINEIRSKELADMITLLGKIEAGQPKKSPILEFTERLLGAGHK